MFKWIKENWIRIILWTIIISIITVLTLLMNYGCEQGWYDCSPTNMTVNINAVVG